MEPTPTCTQVFNTIDKDKRPVPGVTISVMTSDETSRSCVTDRSGMCSLILTTGKKYTFSASKPGYYPVSYYLIACTSPIPITMTPVTTPKPTPTPKPMRRPPCDNYGDVNFDGYVTEKDARQVEEFVVGRRVFTEEQKRRADVDGDGKVTTADAMLIARYAMGVINTFPVCAITPTTSAPLIQQILASMQKRE